MKSYQNNMADQDVVVHSLKVLTDIDSGTTKQIRRDIETVKQQSIEGLKKQEEYWESLSDDGVISVIEKQSLKREMENIAQSKSAITAQASSLGYTSEVLDDYIATYNALRAYIYTTLHLFDHMDEPTELEDRVTFNTMFSNYFFSENYVLLAITEGILDTLEIRVLDNLQEEGTEGETGLYHGGLYQYTDGAWKNVSTGNYKGARDELPTAEPESFFLASDDFTTTENFIVNGEELLVNGETFVITRAFRKGYIYYLQDNIWFCENDKTNWRYAAAFADVLNVTGELPQIFQDGLDNLQAQIDTMGTSLEEEIALREGGWTIIAGDLVQIGPWIGDIVDDINDQIEEQAGDISDIDTALATKISHLPVYLGATSAVNSLNPQDNGNNSGTWYKSKVYRWRNNTWEGLDPTDSTYQNYYMMALTDVLACNVTDNGYFAAVFAQSIFANNAVINNLETRTLHLQQGGSIESAKTIYSRESQGLKIDADGNIDANGDTHIKGKVAIGVGLKNAQNQYLPDFDTYDAVIGGNTLIKSGVKIQGNLDGATGSFSGFVSAKGLNINGFGPGNIKLLSIYYDITGFIPGNYGTAYKAVGTGTFRCKLKCCDSSVVSSGNATYILKKNDITVFTVTHPIDGVVYTHSIDVSVEFGDILKITGDTDGGRVTAYTFDCDICIDTENQIMSLLSTPYSYHD